MTLLLGGLVNSDLTVEHAASILRAKVVQDRRAALKVSSDIVAMQRRSGNSYELDRGARILATARQVPYDGVLNDGERDLFEREHALGSQSLRAAFDELVELVPDLGRLKAETTTTSVAAASPIAQMSTEEVEELIRLVGPDARHPNPLIRTLLANRIARLYVSAFRGRRPMSSLDEPLFGRPFDPTKVNERLEDLRRSARQANR